jgi:hypothetical protein
MISAAVINKLRIGTIALSAGLAPARRPLCKSIAAATGEVPMAEEAGMEAATAMSGDEAVMAAWASTDLVFSGTAYFSMH